jgi:hypothetical protein
MFHYFLQNKVNPIEQENKLLKINLLFLITWAVISPPPPPPAGPPSTQPLIPSLPLSIPTFLSKAGLSHHPHFLSSFVYLSEASYCPN